MDEKKKNDKINFENMQILPISATDNCYTCDCGDGCDGYGNDCVSCDSDD
ncbi:hypothetical protein KKA66_02480 [Patescibacteria group bacterium]|nr:hypothetical protein [Patescibacteria group bacterium]